MRIQLKHKKELRSLWKFVEKTLFYGENSHLLNGHMLYVHIRYASNRTIGFY